MSENNALHQKTVAQVLDGLRQSFRSPATTISTIDDNEIMVDGNVVCVGAIRRMIAQQPPMQDQVVNHFVGTALKELRDIPDKPYYLAAGFLRKIMPWILTAAYQQQMGMTDMATHPLIDDCVVGYVIDTQTVQIKMTQTLMQRWQLDLPTLAQHAIDNWTKQSMAANAPALEISSLKGGGRYIELDGTQKNASSNILLPPIHTRITHALGDDALVCIPARDQGVAFTANPYSATVLMQREIAKAAVGAPHPITPTAFSVAAIQAAVQQLLGRD